MNQTQLAQHASYKGANGAIGKLSKGNGKLGKAMQRFQEDITEEDDPSEDPIRDKLKYTLFKTKFPEYQNMVISGVTIHWHEMEAMFKIGLDKLIFHLRGIKGSMRTARPTGQQAMPPPGTNHPWMRPRTVE